MSSSFTYFLARATSLYKSLFCMLVRPSIFFCLNDQAYNCLIHLQDNCTVTVSVLLRLLLGDLRTVQKVYTGAVQIVYTGQSTGQSHDNCTKNIGKSICIAVGKCLVTTGNEVLARVLALQSVAFTHFKRQKMEGLAELCQTQEIN